MYLTEVEPLPSPPKSGAMVEQQSEPAPADLVMEDEEHPCRTMQALNMMRKNKRFCDVVLQVGNHEIYAHRAVLASVSPYLLELFTTDDESGTHENIIQYRLNGGFEKDSFERLVNYAYTSKLEVPYSMVRPVYLAANRLKMERVARECSEHLLRHLTAANCIELRSLPGAKKDKSFVDVVDTFISKEIEAVSKTPALLALPCLRVEFLVQTREEMALESPESLCNLVLDWARRQWDSEDVTNEMFTEKTHLLYLALDNSLQDCSGLPSGDANETELVQDYKKMSKRITPSNTKNRRRTSMQPAKPRVLIYSRNINEISSEEHDVDWKLIAAHKVADYSFLAVVAIGYKVAKFSIILRFNPPSSPSPSTTPTASRPSSVEKPDTYCLLSNMRFVKCAAGCANLGDSLLVCGGYDRGECLRSVEMYNPLTNVWQEMTPMKEARGRFSISVLSGKAFAVGGSNGTTELSTVEMFDPDSKAWSRVAPLPLARSNAGVCALDGKMYCIGGWNGQFGMKQCDVYDPPVNAWSTIAPLNVGRYQAGACALNGCVYAVGGCDAWNCLSSVEVYDPQKNAWVFTEGLITSRRGCGVAVFKGKIYAVGGSDGSHSLSSTEIYDPASGVWSPGPNMTSSRANVGVTVINGRLYAVGGFSGKIFLNTIEYLDQNTDEWTTFVPKASGICENGKGDEEKKLENGLDGGSETGSETSSEVGQADGEGLSDQFVCNVASLETSLE